MINMQLVLGLGLALIYVAACAPSSVSFDSATYVGSVDDSTGTEVFTGIRYAQPPIGEQRFQPPISNQLTPGAIIDHSASTSNRCYGFVSIGNISGSEDCLTLDLVRPAHTTEDALLPVYAFIHGGDFESGDKSDYDGRNLVKSGIALGANFIYVAMNYRLGFLGFPGGVEAKAHNGLNLGLLDQRMALQWINDNIVFFGGNPNKVVIGGQGSGADSVAYQMLAYGGRIQPGDDGYLFHGAILESGSATRSSVPEYSYFTRQDNYNAMAYQTGCNVEDSFSCLQQAPISQLISAYGTVYNSNIQRDGDFVSSPVVDGDFIEDYPSVLMAAGKFPTIYTLLGTTTTELVNQIPIYNGLGNDAAVLQILQKNFEYAKQSTLEKLMAYYPTSNFGNTGPPLSGGQWSRTVAINNDVQMFCPMYELANVHKGPVYKYRWNSVLSTAPIHNYLGVPIESELSYLFPTYDGNTEPFSADDTILQSRFQRNIIGFITSLDPNILPNLGKNPEVNWPAWQEITGAPPHPQNATVMVFQRGDIYTEFETINKTICAFIKSKDLEFLR